MRRIRLGGREALVASLIAAGTVALYLPTGGFSFLGYDDGAVLTLNPHLRDGLTWSAVRWALSTHYLGNWVPVTWLSHLADISLFGLRPGPHHLVNVAVHAGNAVLLLVFMRRSTGMLGRSAAVAGLFAFHPLHVQSVAWVTLRRDVLMGLFLLLALLAWERWVRRREVRWYLFSLAAFALGLMSKPLLVILPILLLLLDWWPFGRLVAGPKGRGNPGAGATATRLFVEKTPFFLLSLAAGALSLQDQHYAMSLKGHLPFAYRAMNAVVSTVWYLAKSLWPSRLAIIYPHPGREQSAAVALMSALLLALATAAALRLGRRLPWLAGGWFWFIVGLLPVLGLLAQVGEQARADRYMYLPLIGVSWTAVWGLEAFAARQASLRRALPAVALLALAGYAGAAFVQLRYWKDDFTVFGRALEITRNNYIAETNLGRAWIDQDRLDLAEQHLRAGLRMFPDYPGIRNDLGIIALRQGRLADAEREFSAALAAYDGFGHIHRNLGAVLSRQGRSAAALTELRRAIELDPEDALALEELALLLARSGQGAESVDLLRRAATLDPGNRAIRTDVGLVLTDLGRLAEGETVFRAAVQLDPADSVAANNLGMNLARQGRIDEARLWFTQALQLDPQNETARANFELTKRPVDGKGQPGGSSGFPAVAPR